MSVADLINPHILSLRPYASARDEFSGSASVFLDANENSLGTPGERFDYSRYPDPYQKDLKRLLSDIKSIAKSRIFLGNGSDEPIDLLIRLFCQPGRDQIVLMPPTYGMYAVSAEINNIKTVEIPLTPGFQIDRNAYREMELESAKMIFICSPNNPTGNSMEAGAIKEILDTFKGIVIVDEAYIDFCPSKSLTGWLDSYPNLVILQTLSKAWGMAGVRLGMALASEEIVQFLNKIKPPYNINSLTQEVVAEVLAKEEAKNRMVDQISAERAFLIEQAQKLSLVERIFPSEANFVLVKVKDAGRIYKYLLDRAIVVRDRSSVILCEGGLRITVGTREENEALIEALNSYPV